MTFLNARTVKYLSAPCGAGKTYAVCKNVADNLSQANWLHVAPSKDLCDELGKQYSAFGVDATVIHSNNSNPVGWTIDAYLRNLEGKGNVLIITWESYRKLASSVRATWKIFIDEVPQVDKFHGRAVPYSADLVKQYLRVDTDLGNGLGTVAPINLVEICKFVNQPADDSHKPFKDLFADVISDQKEVFVDTAQWGRTINDRRISKDDDEKNRVAFVAMTSPDVFIGTTIVGANIEDSLLFKWLSLRHQVQFEERVDLAAELRPSPCVEPARLSIKYFLESNHFSKRLGKKKSVADADERMLSDKMDALAVEQFASAPFLFVANNDRQSKIVRAAGGQRIPPNPHGLNCFSDSTNIYFSAALNREPVHCSMLARLGLSDADVKTATTGEIIYQCAMRTSLRVAGSTAEVVAIVPDRFSAEHLATLIPTTSITKLGDLEEARPEPYTQVERNRRSEAKSLFDTELASAAAAPAVNDENPTPSNAFMEPASAQRELSCTFHKNRFNKEPQQFKKKAWGVRKLARLLSRLALSPAESKDELCMINPAVFEHEGGQGLRRKEHFKAASMLILDFDNGTLTPSDFERIFWLDDGLSKRLSFWMCNSFSRCEAQPNRFRVYLPYRAPASRDEHMAAFDYVARRLLDAGYGPNDTMLDRACRHGVQSFYLPCTNRYAKEWAFFIKHGLSDRELDAHALDAQACPQVRTVTVSGAADANAKYMVTSFDLAKLKTELLGMTSGRNDKFFHYSLMLARNGKSREAVETELNGTAASDRKLQNKVQGCLKSLDEYGYFRLSSAAVNNPANDDDVGRQASEA